MYTCKSEVELAFKVPQLDPLNLLPYAPSCSFTATSWIVDTRILSASSIVRSVVGKLLEFDYTSM